MDKPMEAMLTPAEVSALFAVHPKTLLRWAQDGKIPCIRTPGGHRRYPVADIHAIMRGEAGAGGGL